MSEALFIRLTIAGGRQIRFNISQIVSYGSTVDRRDGLHTAIDTISGVEYFVQETPEEIDMWIVEVSR